MESSNCFRFALTQEKSSLSVVEEIFEVGAVEIREEQRGDIEAIYEVNSAAFPTEAEADLVNALRAAGALLLSLVAVDNGKVVGHIAFSPVEIRSDRGVVETVGLAPLAVLPEYQRKGFGSRLIVRGLQELEAADYKTIFVLGEPHYYQRFGFVPAAKYRIRWEHEAPREAFMVKELLSGALNGVTGVVRFRPEFEGV